MSDSENRFTRLNDVKTFNDGDVFRWHYETTEGMHSPYWCKSQIAVCKTNGDLVRLEDTYWGGFGSDNHNLFREIGNINVELIGNLHDFEPCKRWDLEYYDPKDILDISHSNVGERLYLRKGAKKCVKTYLANLDDQAREVLNKIDGLEGRLAWIEQERKRVAEEGFK